MRESRTYGVVRGAPSDGRPYRDQKQTIARPITAAHVTLVKAQATISLDSFDLKLPVNPAAKDIHWPAIGVVRGVGDELIVKGEVC